MTSPSSVSSGSGLVVGASVARGNKRSGTPGSAENALDGQAARVGSIAAGLRGRTPPAQGGSSGTSPSALLGPPPPPPPPPQFPGAFLRRSANATYGRPGKDGVAAAGTAGDRRSPIGSASATPTVGHSLATLASDMTLLQILRGPYRGALSGESCESLVGGREARRSVSITEEMDDRAEGGEAGERVERDSPGKRMAERWLSGKEREVEVAFL